MRPRLDRVLGDLGIFALLLGTLALVAVLERTARLSKSGPAIELPNDTTGEPSGPVAGLIARAVEPEQPPAPPPLSEAQAAEQRAQYDRPTSKTIIELQQFRSTETMPVHGADGRQGQATLINLNPRINGWFILTLDWGKTRETYHIENAGQADQQLHLDEKNPGGIVISTAAATTPCELWLGKPTQLEQARKSGLPYAPICDARVSVRNQVAGHRTNLEAWTDFLRDNVWRGDDVVGFVRDTFFKDSQRETGDEGSVTAREPDDVITPALLSASHAYKSVIPGSLAIDVDGPKSRQFPLGRWYPVRNVQGAYVSVMQPQAVSEEVVKRSKGLVNALDSVEASSLNYLVAFDLSLFDVRYSVGTDHPRVGWSPRVSPPALNGKLPGPDGIGSTAPVITTGMVNPAFLKQVGATFTGGFKREHGAFKYGDLAQARSGSHYGFVENGAVISKLNPGLATLFVLNNGAIQMKTWTPEDDRLLRDVGYARQNGVPLVEIDPATGNPVAGPFVAKWGLGNWSGSAAGQLRSVRAGACLLQTAQKQFLVYGYFSTATPSAMALVFQAYGCRYAMLLDMNSLEHTYLALYARRERAVTVQHLVREMAGIDKTSQGRAVPRFVGYPDSRDFFYLVRRKGNR